MARLQPKLASETRQRVCSRMSHRDRPATHVRTVKVTTGTRYIAFYPECAECAARTTRVTKGTLETVRAL